MHIILGPSGSPKNSTLEGLGAVKSMGLQAMEISFTHGVRMGIDKARQIGEANARAGLVLSIHAPYYINLCSENEEIRKASIKRIVDTCERAHYIRAKKVVFHPAYYGQMRKEECFDIVKSAVKQIKAVLEKNKWHVELAPETTGRIAQFGTLEEILELSKTANCSFCVDIAHIYARNGGHIDYSQLFDKLEETKQKEMHFHFEGIEINRGGEGGHLVMTGNKPDFLEFAKELLKRDHDSVIISESPITWQDSLNMKKILERLGYRWLQ